MLKNKKKIACFALASALVIPCAVGLTGCGNSHTHAFTSDPFYEVVTEGGVKTARSWKECSCGAEDAHKKVDNAVIVTPETIQTALDGKIVLRDGQYCIGQKEENETYESISGKTIVLDQGEYNEILEFRPTKESNTKVYTHNDYINSDSPITYDEMTDDTKTYFYMREINNLTFAGTENATLKQSIVMCSAFGSYILSYIPNFYDSIRNTYASNNSAFNMKYRVENLKFTRLNFSGAYGRITIINKDVLTQINNISIDNCKFETDEVYATTGDERIICSSIHVFGYNDTAYLESVTISNITIKNNIISGHTIGVYARVVDTLTIQNNNISKSVSQLIGIYDSCGDFTISNNTLSDSIGTEPTRERAIRFNNIKEGSITIENNNFSNCSEDRTASDEGFQILKAGGLTNVTFSLKNNTYEGKAVQDDSGSNETEFIAYRP